MFFFKKLWVSWFGKKAQSTPSPAEVLVKMKMDSLIREAREDAEKRRKARPTPTRYVGSSPTPARPSEDAMDGSSGIGITEAIIMAEILTSDSNVSDTPITNDDAPWSGDGGSSGGAGAEGSWDSSSNDSSYSSDSSSSYDSGSSYDSSSSYDSGSSDNGSL